MHDTTMGPLKKWATLDALASAGADMPKGAYIEDIARIMGTEGKRATADRLRGLEKVGLVECLQRPYAKGYMESRWRFTDAGIDHMGELILLGQQVLKRDVDAMPLHDLWRHVA